MDDLELVDNAVAGWADRHPDLDVASMRTFLLLARLTARAGRRVQAAFEAHGITLGEFDVLAALVAAPDEQLRPSQLAALALLSPAGMTNRVDRLVAAGLVEREADPEDRRSSRVRLTEAGRRAADAAVRDHVAVEGEVLAPLAPHRREELDGLLETLLAAMAAPTGDGG